jgi:hypothetical protein
MRLMGENPSVEIEARRSRTTISVKRENYEFAAGRSGTRTDGSGPLSTDGFTGTGGSVARLLAAILLADAIDRAPGFAMVETATEAERPVRCSSL